MDTGHALFAPSSMARTVACARSATLAALYPELGVHPEAEEGTAAHWGLAETIHGREVVLGQVAPNGIALTQEMLEGIDTFMERYHAVLAQIGDAPYEVHVEETLPWALHEDNWGTPDLWIWVPSTGTLYLFDFKFGHKPVQVFECWQLVNYVALIGNKLGWTGLSEQRIRVHMDIVQPRAYHAKPQRAWQVVASDLRAHINQISNAIGASLATDPQATVNPECDYCPGRVACSAHQRASFRGIAIAQSVTPHDMTPAAMSREHEMLLQYEAVMVSRRKGLEEQLLHLVRSGQRVPGVTAEASTGADEWTKPVDEVAALGEMLGKNLLKPPALVTPVQARKLGLDARVVAKMVRPKSGAIKLVRHSDAELRQTFN